MAQTDHRMANAGNPASDLRTRLYEAYASQHAGCGSGRAAALIYSRDIRPRLLPPDAGPVVDIGCGQGALVRLLLADGYDAAGIDVSPEQVSLAHAAGLEQVRLGDYRNILRGPHGRPGRDHRDRLARAPDQG